jgi:hypothetical protein
MKVVNPPQIKALSIFDNESDKIIFIFPFDTPKSVISDMKSVYSTFKEQNVSKGKINSRDSIYYYNNFQKNQNDKIFIVSKIYLK